MITRPTISTFLSFDDQAEQAAHFYVGVFPNSKIVNVARYPDVGQEAHHRPAGSVMLVAFELDGQPFTALNGGPSGFNQAISFVVHCDSQEEVDYYWEKLSDGGDASAQQCGWLTDRYGASWQVVPDALLHMIADPDPAKAGRAMQAMMQMKKLDLNVLKRAYAG